MFRADRARNIRSSNPMIQFAAAELSSKYRRSDRHGTDALPVQAVQQRYQLGVVELDTDMSDARPAERGFLEALCIQTYAAAVPPNNLDPVCPLRTEYVKCATERIAPGIPNWRKQAVWSFPKVHWTFTPEGIMLSAPREECAATQPRQHPGSPER